MRKNFMILVIIVCVVLALLAAGAYAIFMPHYKTIEVNGYTFEVPDGDVNVTQVNNNYKTYDDKEHNITIKSYAINDVNETNYTGAYDIGVQLGSNAGQNCTYRNVSLYNNSGTYSYFDYTTYQMIVITSNDLESITHAVKSMNKTEVKPSGENLTVNLTNINNTTDANNTTTTTTAKKSTPKKTTSSSKSQKSDDNYASSDDVIVVNPKTGMKELGPAHPNYGTPNDPLQAQHSR